MPSEKGGKRKQKIKEGYDKQTVTLLRAALLPKLELPIKHASRKRFLHSEQKNTPYLIPRGF